MTVLGPAENIGSRTAWLCRCDCGKTLTAKTVHLRAGKVRSCGCLKSSRSTAKQKARPADRAKAAKAAKTSKAAEAPPNGSKQKEGQLGGLAVLHYIDGTCVEMLRKNTPRRNNTSGVVGVDWVKRDRRWRAAICFMGKRYYLGSYKLFNDAVDARRRAEQEMHIAFLKAFDSNDKDRE